VLTETNAIGDTNLHQYDDVGNRIQTVDEEGRLHRWEYDGLNRVISETNAADHTVFYTYDGNGNRTHIIQSVSGVTVTEVFTYDRANRLVASQDGDGVVTSYAYDGVGNVTLVTDADDVTVETEYDLVNRPITVTLPMTLQTIYGYDDGDRKTTVRDAEDNVTTYDYDPLGRLLSVLDAVDETTQFEYDPAGNRLVMIDANEHETHYRYDGVGRRISLTFGITHTTIYTYDQASNLTARLDPNGAVVAFDYDPLNRLETIDYPSDPTVSYTYDDVGNRLTMTDGSGSTAYQWDDLNRPTVIMSTQTGQNARVVSYGYNEAGHRTRLTYPGATRVVTYTYSGAGRMDTVEDWLDNVTDYDYSPAGRLVTTTLPVGVISLRGYDDAGRLISVSHATTSTTLAAYEYQLDDVGNRLERVGPSGTETTTYGYDNVYRLRSVEYPDGDTTLYGYDPVGNREAMTETIGFDQIVSSYAYDVADRLRTRVRDSVTTTFTWDENGNALSNGGTEYVFDEDNRLVEVDDGAAASFAYNGDGLRVAVTEGAATNRYLWDLANDLPELLEADDRTLVYGLDLLAEVDATNEAAYHLTDGLGSSTIVVDDSSAVIREAEFDAFGVERESRGTYETPMQFAGEQSDGGGLVYLRARYYDPDLGRFLSRDSLEGFSFVPQSLNPYMYAHDNPARYTDPAGTCVFTGVDTVVCVAGAAWAAYELYDNAVTINAWLQAELANLQCATNIAEAIDGPWLERVIVVASLGPGTGSMWRHVLDKLAGIPFMRRLVGREVVDVAYHWTTDGDVPSIMREGLRPGSYVTPQGGLSPTQAHLDLALNPARGPRNSVIRVDVDGLRREGYHIPDAGRVGRNFNMPGGGLEMRLPYRVPPKYLSVPQ
jgi:RHS repeat-associated protein